MDMERIAKWAFTIFVILAIIMGLVVGYMNYANTAGTDDTRAYVMLILLILGIIVGLISITAKEVTPFLIASIALIVAASANVWFPLFKIHELLYDWATEILNFIVAFAAPAAVIIAIREVFMMAKEK
jgi:hypothetical protein